MCIILATSSISGHVQTTLPLNSQFYLHSSLTNSEIFCSFYEFKECGGEPQVSPTYSSSFYLPTPCQTVINEKVTVVIHFGFFLFPSRKFLNRIQIVEHTLFKNVLPSQQLLRNAISSVFLHSNFSHWEVMLTS